MTNIKVEGKGGISALVVEDSTAQNGARLITMQLRYPRFVHAEFMTHRVFSRNASSSRAIPVEKMIAQVRNDPAMPIHWGKNQPGMQAREELGHAERDYVKAKWFEAAGKAADVAQDMANEGAHKQVVNRILEPFQFMHVIVSATEWSNFFELRDHPDADPNIAELARVMRLAQDRSGLTLRQRERLVAHGWHLPYITNAERLLYEHEPILLAQASSGRCARVSYMKHDGTAPSILEDVALHLRLVGGKPIHASPVEHQAYPLVSGQEWDKNFRGWRQHRTLVEASFQ